MSRVPAIRIHFTKLLRYGVYISAVLALIAVLYPHPTRATGSATFSFDPASGSHDVDTTFGLDIYEDSGAETINGAEAAVTYDTSQLELASVDVNGDFDFPLPVTQNGNVVRISAGDTRGLTARKRFAHISFKAKVGSGSTTITLADSSSIRRQSDNEDLWDRNANMGTYSLTTPADQSQPPDDNPPPAPKPPAPPKSNPAPPSETTPPTETPVPVNEISPTYLVAIKVVDSHKKAVKGAKVTINNTTVTTTSSGIASFANLKAGKYKVTVKINDQVTSQDITVKETANRIAVQEFQLALNSGGLLWINYIAILLVLLLVVGGIVVRLRTLKKPTSINGAGPTPNNEPPSAPLPPATTGVIHPTNSPTTSSETNPSLPADPTQSTVVTPSNSSPTTPKQGTNNDQA